MRTLFLNPPSFECFDGGASSRWPASREIESYWYPVWLCYPAGMLPDSKVLRMRCRTRSRSKRRLRSREISNSLCSLHRRPDLEVDVKIAEMLKDANPEAQGVVCRSSRNHTSPKTR